MGCRRRILVSGALIALVAAATGSGAGAVTTSTTPTSVQISGGYTFTGSVIVGPGLKRPRKLDAYQTAVWVQSWIGDLYYGKPTHENPPAGLPVYEVDVTGQWGSGEAVETRASFYASDGKSAWVAFPSEPPVQVTPTAPPRVVTGWFLAPPRVIQTFAGRGTLAPTAGLSPQPSTTTTAAPSTTTGAAAPAHSGSHNSKRLVFLWIAIVLAAAALGSFGVGSLRDRGAREALAAPTVAEVAQSPGSTGR